MRWPLALLFGLAFTVASAHARASAVASTVDFGAKCVGAGFDDTSAFQAAIDTGLTVYAPTLGGACNITHELIIKTAGQLFHGDGRGRTKIVVQPSFVGRGVFVFGNEQLGPIMRDFAVFFQQPDTGVYENLHSYPPAFATGRSSRFEIEHVGCFVATECIDMTSGSSGSTISDFQFSAFDKGIDIDNAFDTVRIIDPHWWPFALTKAQERLFFSPSTSRAVAINVGRADDMKIRGGLFIGGLALHARASHGAGPNINIDSTDFDTFSGILLEDGNLEIAAAMFTLGDVSSIAIKQSGGALTVASSFFFIAAALRQPALDVSGGSLTITGSRFNSNNADVITLSERGVASVVLNANRFERRPSESYKNPTILLSGGRTIVIGNCATDKGDGTGVFIAINNDNPFNRIIGNASPGWPSYTAGKSKGIYLFN